MYLVAVAPGGQQATLSIDPKDTVNDLRRHVKAAHGVTSFDIVYNGEPLKTLALPLSSLGLSEGDKINVLFSAAEKRQDLLVTARIAETAERYEDLVVMLKEAIEIDQNLERTEREMLSTGYRNLISIKRSAWRVVKSELESAGEDTHSLVMEYLSNIETEIKELCNEVLELIPRLESVLTPRKLSDKLFYKKMRGDYHRYHAEVSKDKFHIDCAKELYDSGFEEASAGLEPTDPITLGVALNVSVFYHDIMNDTSHAVDIAKLAFDNAITALDSLDDSSYKDSTLIMQLLRDNLTLWTSEED